MYEIVFSVDAEREFDDLRAFDQRPLLNAIETPLAHEPCKETRNRKMLPGIVPPFDAEPPIWELRVGEYRVYYDVNDEERVVYVRAIRRKPPHKTTEDIL